MERSKLSPEEKRRHFDVFILKAQSGALSDVEKAIAQEAQLLGALASRSAPAWTSEEVGRFSLLIRRQIQRNAMGLFLSKLCDYLDDLEKKLSITPPATEKQLAHLYAGAMIFIDTYANLMEEDAQEEFKELHAFMMRHFDHLDAREDGKAHTKGI